jgi:hypothetical protein
VNLGINNIQEKCVKYLTENEDINQFECKKNMLNENKHPVIWNVGYYL